jgi:hypothetical protein
MVTSETRYCITSASTQEETCYKGGQSIESVRLSEVDSYSMEGPVGRVPFGRF